MFYYTTAPVTKHLYCVTSNRWVAAMPSVEGSQEISAGLGEQLPSFGADAMSKLGNLLSAVTYANTRGCGKIKINL